MPKHVSHELRIAESGEMTVGMLRKQLKQLNPEANVRIKFPDPKSKDGWRFVRSLSLCRAEGEITIW
jgi:hypothetical protein